MTTDFSRRVPLRIGTPLISLPKRSQAASTTRILPMLALTSLYNNKNRVRPPSSSTNTFKSSTTSSFISFDASISTPVRKQHVSPRRSHQMQLGRFLTYLRAQNLAKEKIRRQRAEEKKPRFILRPARSPFRLVLEPLESSSMIAPRVEEHRSPFSPSRLNTPRNSLVDE